jgi:pimeloyl-ACP methyl ester carboxylesterase
VFVEGHVDAGGVRLRYLEAGQGTPLVLLSGPDAATRAHGLLARQFRVIVLESPPATPADVLADGLRRLGVDAFDLMAASSAAETALRLVLHAPDRVRALVLEAPDAIRDAGLERRLPEVAAPTLVLLGTRDETATGRVYKARIPTGHLVYVYDAARAIGAERPEAFAEVVADFLERHDAFVISRARTVIHP